MDLLWDIRMPFTKHSSLSTALGVDGQSWSSYQLQAWVFPENRGPIGVATFAVLQALEFVTESCFSWDECWGYGI